jgi:hypothetical protein
VGTVVGEIPYRNLTLARLNNPIILKAFHYNTLQNTDGPTRMETNNF